MIRQQISPAAVRPIVATPPGNVGFEARRAENGDYFIWLAPDVVNELKALRGADESYSDIILKMRADATG